MVNKMNDLDLLSDNSFSSLNSLLWSILHDVIYVEGMKIYNCTLKIKRNHYVKQKLVM